MTPGSHQSNTTRLNNSFFFHTVILLDHLTVNQHSTHFFVNLTHIKLATLHICTHYIWIYTCFCLCVFNIISIFMRCFHGKLCHSALFLISEITKLRWTWIIHRVFWNKERREVLLRLLVIASNLRKAMAHLLHCEGHIYLQLFSRSF